MSRSEKHVSIIEDSFYKWENQARSPEEIRIVKGFVKLLLKKTASKLGSDFNPTMDEERFMSETFSYSALDYFDRRVAMEKEIYEGMRNGKTYDQAKKEHTDHRIELMRRLIKQRKEESCDHGEDCTCEEDAE